MAELFADFEVNREPRGQRLLRLAGLSLALHALFFASIVYIPVLRDAFNIANRFSGAEMVNEDYEKTDIRQRAVMIDVSGGKFQYPPGYFSQNPVAAEEAPQIIEQAAPAAAPPRQRRPRPVPQPTPETAPSPAETASTETPGGPAGKSLPMSEEEGEQNLDKLAEQNKVKRPKTVNKKPFIDLLVKWKPRKESGQLDLNGPIEMTIEADRNADGTLSNATVTYIKGDPELIDVTKDFAAALSASGALEFLEGTKHLTLKLKLDTANVSISASTEMETTAQAVETARGYNGLLLAGAIIKRGHDEATIMKSSKVTSSGKQVIVSFSMPRETAGALLSKQVPTS
ncbi:MAG TPA: hypothetical protein VF723_15780 [Pyrinomonadaceae bacterium]|jgi:hypothetical protein